MTLYKQAPFYYGPTKLHVDCKECFGFTFGSERNSRLGAPVSHASDSTCSYFSSSFFTAFLVSCPSPPSRPPAQDNYDKIALLPALTTSRISFSPLFLRTLGNDDQHSAAATRHQSPSIQFLVSFSSFLPTFSLYIRHNDDAYALSLTTPLLSYQWI